MPRQNQPRSMNVEEFVARRIEVERRSHNWSYETLAKRMAQVGCTIQPSALQRIEKGDPPRKISVDEAVAMAKVFKLSLEEFLQEGESVDDAKLRRGIAEAESALRELEWARSQVGDAENAYRSAIDSVAQLLGESGPAMNRRFAELKSAAEESFGPENGSWEEQEVYSAIQERAKAPRP